ncbi:hypothetical protein [Pandoraea pnomenusa]|uniref:plasmid fertility inhibition factor family protein n=1 Tax=Pandoraea pnomenusa TaxID=93220 RepID=UPI00334267FF
MDKLNVPVSVVPGGAVRMYEDSGYTWSTFNGKVASKGWEVVRAIPEKLLRWLEQSKFSNASLGDRFDGFHPYPHKLAELESLKKGQGRDLDMTLVVQKTEWSYEFVNGRHRAYWLAANGAEFVPILVPVHQVAHFTSVLI